MSTLSARLSTAVRLIREYGEIKLNSGRKSTSYETVGIEIASRCNLGCPLCPAARDARTVVRDTQFISRGDFERIVAVTKDVTRGYVLNLYGESLLHPEFFEMLDIAVATGRHVSLSTNLNYAERLATRLAAYEGVDIICSIDGWDPESYLEYRRGGRFAVMKSNLAVMARGKANVYAQFLVKDGDDPKLPALHAFMAEVGLPLSRLRIAPLVENFKNEAAETIEGTCEFPYDSIYFTSDGRIQPCCINVGRDLHVVHAGELAGPQDALNHPALVEVRRQLATDKNRYESCRSCGGSKVGRRKLAVLADRVRAQFVRPTPEST